MPNTIDILNGIASNEISPVFAIRDLKTSGERIAAGEETATAEMAEKLIAICLAGNSRQGNLPSKIDWPAVAQDMIDDARIPFTDPVKPSDARDCKLWDMRLQAIQLLAIVLDKEPQAKTPIILDGLDRIIASHPFAGSHGGMGGVCMPEITEEKLHQREVCNFAKELRDKINPNPLWPRIRKLLHLDFRS